MSICCKVTHVPDYGACAGFEAGMNGRCVYCDHSQACHPGKGPLCNGPLHPYSLEQTKPAVDGSNKRPRTEPAV